jgi:hypothetical protein
VADRLPGYQVVQLYAGSNFWTARGVGAAGAVFAWVLPDGIAWIESGYADPMGAPMPCAHKIAGMVWRSINGLSVQGPEYCATVTPAATSEIAVDQEIVEAFAEFDAWLRDQGTTWEEEAARLEETQAAWLGG